MEPLCHSAVTDGLKDVSSKLWAFYKAGIYLIYFEESKTVKWNFKNHWVGQKVSSGFK